MNIGKPHSHIFVPHIDYIIMLPYVSILTQESIIFNLNRHLTKKQPYAIILLLLKGNEAVNSLYGYNTESVVFGVNGTAHNKVSYSRRALSGQPSVTGERGKRSACELRW
jgi:hypothetical protein